MRKRERKPSEVRRAIAACRDACAQTGRVMCVDALAAALEMTCEELFAQADRRTEVGALLVAAIQECTAETVAAALSADPKTHPLWMFYLRNRASFADKPERADSGVSITFVGEERI